MKQHISTLMDGEMSDEDAEILLDKIKYDAKAQQEWLSFHLIGDALRQSDGLSRGVGNSFFERLHAEPTVLAPQRKRTAKANLFAMSAVASIMAMAFLAWLSANIDSSQIVRPSQRLLVQQSADDFRMAGNPVNEGMNDYLQAHHEFSPGTDVRGATSFIHTVAFRNAGVGR